LKVHLLSAFPPPYGGVSVHVYRLRARLVEQGHQVTVWCDHDRPEEGLRRFGSKEEWIRTMAQEARDAIIHIHNAHLVAGLLAPKHPHLINTVHNQARIDDTFTGGRFPIDWLRRKRVSHHFKKVRYLIGVSDKIKEQMVEIMGFRPDQVRVINAYLPPLASEVPAEKNLEAFEAFRQRFSVLATANTSATKLFHGADQYGMDMCVELAARMKDRNPDFGLVLAAPVAKGTAYLSALRKRAEDLGVSDRILWLLELGAYHPIVRECQLFLRPANTDGFAISIVEACEFGVPVVASDACVRPPGCLLFRDRDMDDFQAKVELALGDLDVWSQRSLESRERDRFPEVLAYYEDVLGTQTPS
jgi:glycosyltransferase involved in cell wall biosynthesis